MADRFAALQTQMPLDRPARSAARIPRRPGLGRRAHRAADPLIASTPNNVHRHAQRFGVGFRDAAATGLRLPPEAGAIYDRAAAKRGLTRETLIELLLAVAAADPGLLDNILDDGA